MVIIGVDYHPSFQAIAFLEEETGGWGEQSGRRGQRAVSHDLERSRVQRDHRLNLIT